MNKPLFLLLALILLALACKPQKAVDPISKALPIKINPPAPGFDLQNSDPKAIEIADQVMDAMGGRQAYDNTRYLSWNFFGSRKLWWDKLTGEVRIESLRNAFKSTVNIHTLNGRVWKDSVQMTNPDSLKKYLARSKNIWINDSYWLLMPFKLKDSGVTLKYIGEENSDSLHADILELGFREVGVTPENKYHVYVDKSDRLIKQWAFFGQAADDTARFVTPWKNYQRYGDLLLSGDRGQYQLTEIAVGEHLAEALEIPID